MTDVLDSFADHRHAMACNGSGVATMMHSGAMAAQMILGGSNKASAYPRIPFRTKPL